MSLARQNKGPRKDGGPHGQASPTQPRRGGGPGGGGGGPGGAWRGPHNNPSIMQQNYSPRNSPAMMSQVPLPSANTPGQADTFSNGPNYGGNPNGSPSAAPPPLPPVNLIGSLIVVSTHSGVRHEGTLVHNDQSHPGISLKDAKDLVNPGAALIPSYFIPAQQIANWKRSEPMPTPTMNGNKALDTFRTDRDISSAPGGPRERELQAWKPDASGGGQNQQGSGAFNRDSLTFGAQPNSARWDQFAVNEKLFGISTDYNEEMYTTKLDRSTPDYRDKERKAQQLANEIEGSVSANPHLREERGHADDTINEEDKYGAVQRGPGAYVPPGARRADGTIATTPKADTSKPATPIISSPPPSVPKLSVNGPDGAVNGEHVNGVAKVNGDGEQKAEDPAVVSFRSFVSSERQRITQKKNAMSRIERDKRLADLVNFGSTFKLNKPMPADLVPILAKDEDKQKAIIEKSAKDAEDGKARRIGMSIPPTAGPIPVPAPNAIPVINGPTLASAKAPANRASVIQAIPPFKGKSANPTPVTTATTGSGPGAAGKATPPTGKAPLGKRPPIAMTIAKIPPFDPSKRRAGGDAAANGTTTTTPASPTSVGSSRLNVNASAFRPNPTAPAFKPGGPSPVPSTSPSSKPAETVTPNPYFGVRAIKKGVAVHVKDDFNPFKYNKVSDAATVPAVWPFTGRRYLAMLPPVPHPPPLVPHPSAPSYEEDPAAQQAAQAARMAAYPIMYYPYPGGYPGPQPPQQHMMATPNQAPPGGYMGSPYMHHMQYPQGVPQNGTPMYPQQMPGMPPQQGYMPPPPPQGGYQPNGGPRGSMPPTPIPQHAYAGYHQSPQMQHQHALPYQMMMPQQAPPHGYDPQQQQQQQQQGPGPMGVGHQ